MNNLLELFRYGIGGVLTTAVNFVVYYLLLHIHMQYLIANSIAWVFAVLFAYWFNRKHVFHSDTEIRKEFLSFVSMRFLTLLIENGLLFVSVTLLKWNPSFSKILVSVITVIGNYLFCRFQIFRKEA